MKKFKFYKWIILIISGVVLLPTITSCGQVSYQANKDSISSPIKDNIPTLSFVNYFDGKLIPNKQQQVKIKQQINQVVKNYRLNEWNHYYSQVKNDLIKAKVLNLSWSDYQNIYVNHKLINHQMFKNLNEIVWTKIYMNQDPQFRYFNDFINFINNENTNNQEDFLYLRWVYYSIDAAIKYRSIKAVNKPIYEINITDWSKAIIEMIVSGNFNDLKAIVQAFLNYYGIDFKNNKSNENIEIDFSLISNSIIHLMLVTKDLLMRASCKDNDEINRYPLWKAKIKRIQKMYTLTKQKYQLLANSFNGNFTIDKDNLPNDMDIGEIKKQANMIFNQIKDWLMILIDQTIANLVTVKFNDYCDVKGN